MKIPFNKTYQTGDEEKYMLESVRSGAICGKDVYKRQAHGDARPLFPGPRLL